MVGGPLSLKTLQLSLLSTWQRVKDRCVEACTSSGSADCEVAFNQYSLQREQNPC